MLMTPNDIFCSRDTTILIKAIQSLPGSFVDALPPTPLGDAYLTPVAVKKAGLS